MYSLLLVSCGWLGLAVEWGVSQSRGSVGDRYSVSLLRVFRAEKIKRFGGFSGDANRSDARFIMEVSQGGRYVS